MKAKPKKSLEVPVNAVVEWSDNCLQSITAYERSDEGYEEALAHFKRCIEENLTPPQLDKLDMEAVIDDGYWDDDNGYSIWLHTA